MRDLQCLSSWNTVHSQQHSKILHSFKFTQFFLLWQPFNSFSMLLQQKFLIRWVITIQRNFCLDHTEHGWLSHHNKSLRFSREWIHTLHISLRLLHKDWADLQRQSCEKIVSIVSKSAAKCIDNFICPLLLSLPQDNVVVARKIGHPLSANSHHILSAIFFPDSLWTVLTDRVPFLFRTKTNKWPLSFSKSSCTQGCESNMCQTFFFIVFCSERNVVEHRHN